jgi:hypothetical protein
VIRLSRWFPSALDFADPALLRTKTRVYGPVSALQNLDKTLLLCDEFGLSTENAQNKMTLIKLSPDW